MKSECSCRRFDLCRGAEMTQTLNRARVTEGWAVQILLLTWAAGSMDALGYLGLDHVFTANMTGNTVLLGLAVGRGQVLAALRSVSALLGFVVGLAVGASVIEAQKPASDTKRAVSRAILVEGAVLAAFTVLWHLPVRETSPAMLQALILSSAGAMGIQSAIVRRLNLPGIATTYITGTLTSFVAGIVWSHGASQKTDEIDGHREQGELWRPSGATASRGFLRVHDGGGDERSVANAGKLAGGVLAPGGDRVGVGAGAAIERRRGGRCVAEQKRWLMWTRHIDAPQSAV